MKPTSFLLILFFSIFQCTNSNAQQDQPTEAPENKGFKIGSDITGNAVKMVNLYTGEVVFPITAATLPGANGGFNFNITYNSAGVEQDSKLWNKTRPTGVVGLGWQYDLPIIVANTKETGNTEDDDFFLMEGGINNKLIYVSGSTTKKYTTETLTPWTITYTPGIETWSVTKEDGITYRYGGKNNGQNSIQYLVKWGNWIGNSSNTSGQSRLASAWYLSEIVNRFDERIRFSYKAIEQYVGSTSGKKHTEASYLEEITGPSGQQIKFHYAAKKANEYVEPHTEQPEPDGYQEQYEKLYLDYIETFNDSGYKLNKTDFTYSFIGEGNLEKRLLTSITGHNNSLEKLSDVAFKYNQTGELKGKIQTIVTSSGASIDYTYSSSPVVPNYSDQKMTLTAPSGYAEPEIYWGPDYAVVAWRELLNGGHTNNARRVKTYLYTWSGYWQEQQLSTYNNVELENGYFKNLKINTGRDIIAVANKPVNSQNKYYVHLYHRDSRSGQWTSATAYHEDVNYGDPTLLVGDKFAALHTFRDGDIFTYIWNGSGWTKKIIDQSGNEFESTGTGNWIMSHQKGGNDYLKMHHLNENNEWITVNVASPFNTDHSSRSYWFASPSFAAVVAPGNPEFIYSWSENFSSFIRHNVLGSMDDGSTILINNNSTIGIIDTHGAPTGAAKVVRYNGNVFNIHNSNGANYSEHVSVGGDYFLFKEGTNTIKLAQYDANANSWLADQSYPFDYLHKFTLGSCPLEAGIDMFSLYDRFYYKSNNGNWRLDGNMNIPTSTKVQAISAYMGVNSMLYVYTNDSREPLGTGIQLFKNGSALSSDIRLSGEYFYVYNRNRSSAYYAMANGTMFATVSGSQDMLDKTSLNLYYINEKKISGKGEFYPVATIEVNDGYNKIPTSFSYTTSTARADANGRSALFNKVRVIPGSGTPSVFTYGYTDNYFFNGLTSAQSSLPFPSRGADPNFYRNKLGGSVYTSISYDKNGDAVSRNETTYKSFVSNTHLGQTMSAWLYYIRPINIYSRVDGLTSETDYTYNSLGQVSGVVVENYNSFGNKDLITTSYKYWWEAYDPTLSGNFLGPVVQTKKKVNNTITSSSATRWKSHTGKVTASVPYRSYTWKGTGSSDFSAWNGIPSASEWLLNSDIVDRDSDFNVTLTKDLDGQFTTAVYDQNGLKVASVYNAKHAEILFMDFDDHDLINSSGQWTATSNWKFENGTLKFDHATQNANLHNAKEITVNQNQVGEFDFKFLNGPGYLAYHYGKISPTHTPAGSGYTVRISEHAISLYHGSELLGSYTYSNDRKWHHIAIRKGVKTKVMLDGIEVIEVLANYAFGPYDGIYATSSKAYIDNFRLYPENAYMTSTSYDRNYKYAVSATNAQGLTTRNLYNAPGGSVASVGVDGNPLSTSAGYSSFRDKGTFDPADPNVIHSTTIRAKNGFYEDFTTDNPNWTFEDFSNGTTPVYSFSDGELLISSSGGATNSSADIYHIDMQEELTGVVGVEFDFRAIEPGSSHGIGLGLGGDAWEAKNGGTENAVWIGLYSSNRLRAYNNASGWTDVKTNLKTLTTYRVKVVIDLNTQTADYFVDGKLYLNDYPLRANTTGVQKVAFYHYGYGASSSYAVDNLVVYADPVQSSSYIDAAGKVIQQQSKESASTLMVSEVLYDNLGRNDAQTKTTRVTGDFGYRPGFVTTYNRGNGYMYGEVRDLNSDGYYPYSATRFEPSSLGRVLEQSKPGAMYRLGSGKNGSIEYLTTSDIDLGYPGGKYRVIKTTSPDGAEQINMTDMAGNVVLEKAGPTIGTEQEYSYMDKDVSRGNSYSFSVAYSSNVSYNYLDVDGYKTRVLIGTSPGAADIVDSDIDISGSFAAQAGVTYYAEVKYEFPEITLYYDTDCITIIDYNPDFCYDENNCRVMCIPVQTYYDFDCTTPIAYNADYCFNSNNCRIICSGPTPVRYYDYDCRTPIQYNSDYCFNSNNCRIMCPAPASADSEVQMRVNVSLLELKYVNGKVWVDGHTIYATTKYTYDGRGNLWKVYPPNYHNPPNNEVNRNEYVKEYTYDFQGNLKKSDDPDEGVTRYIYDEATGRIRFSQDANGAANGTINYIMYDSEGRVTESGIFESVWNESTLQAMANGNGPSNRVKRQSHKYQYDFGDDVYHRGQLISTSVYSEDGTANEVTEYFTYDREGTKAKGIQVSDYGGGAVTISYESDNLGSLTEEVIPGLGTLKYKYDQLGRLIAIGEDDDEDVYARYEYGTNGELVREILNNNSFVRSLTYDSRGNLTRIDDPYFREDISYTANGYGGDAYYSGLIARTTYSYKGITTFDGAPAAYNYAYRYDKLGRLTVSDNTADNNWDIGVGSATSYDPNGNILSMKKGASQQNYTYYNNTNRVSRTSGSTHQFIYDANGNITQSATKQLSDITYDEYFNKPVSTTYNGGISRYLYGHDGERVVKTNIPDDGSDTRYTLYVRGANDYPVIEKERIDAGDWHTKYFIYGPTGLIASKTITAYEAAGFEPSIATFEADKQAGEEQEFGKSYREAPIVNAQLFNATKGEQSSYSLKLTGESGKKVGVTKMLQLYSGDTVKMKVSAKYLKEPQKDKNFVPAALAAELVGSLGIPAGPEGNLLKTAFENALSLGAAGLSADEKGVPKAFLNYIFFDKHFNPVKFGYKPITEEAYEDGTNRKHEELELEMVADREGFAVVYLSNESREYSEVYFDDFTVQQQSVPQVKFYSRDHLGSTRVVVTAGGTVDARYDYDALGNIVRQEQGFIPNQYRYTGQEYDEETGLHNYRARFYDSDLGRFYATDPAGQFHSPYLAMFNNSVNAKDPDGEVAWFVPIIVGAAIGATAGGIHASNDPNMSIGGGIWRGGVIGAAAGATGAGVSALGGGAMAAGMAGGAVGGAGFSGLSSTWNGRSMMGGALVGGISGFVGGGVGAGIGGGAGALTGGAVSDFTGQLLYSGNVDMMQIGISGMLSFGMYHASSYYNWKYQGGYDFGGRGISYRQFLAMQSDFQKSRFWGKERGGFLLKDGNAMRFPREARATHGINWEGVVPENAFAMYHTHWDAPGKTIFVNNMGNRVDKASNPLLILQQGIGQATTARYHGAYDYMSWDSYVINRFDTSFNAGGTSSLNTFNDVFTRFFYNFYFLRK